MSDDPTKIQQKPAPIQPSKKALEETIVLPRADILENDKTRIQTKSHNNIDHFTDRTPTAGDIIKNRFVLDLVLGSGGMGTVYRALDLRKKEAGDNKPYIAIKLLGDDFKTHPEALVTLQREARKTQELAHPNIVTVYDFDREGDLIYLTMEELKGKPLAEIINDPKNALSPKQKLDILRQIAEGLAYAHSKGIVHSDLKPGNIFLTDKYQVKLLDFGIARAVNTEIYDDSFDAGSLGALTASYASIEMLNRDNPHPSDDIYALGIIACELLGNNTHPYRRQDAQKVLDQHTTPVLPKLNNPFLRRLILNSIAVKRKDRIQNADEFKRKLKLARSGVKTIGIAAALTLVLLLGNVYYLKKYGNNEIDFKDLPEAAQIEFNNHISEATTALGFGDLQGAVINIDQAYAIHHSQKNMLKLRNSILDTMNKNLSNAKDEKAKAFYQEQLEQLTNYPAFAPETPKVK